MDAQQLQEAFRERDVRRVKIGGFDIDGVLRGKYVSLVKFWSAVKSGFGFCDVIFGWDSSDALYDNASVTGWHTGYPDSLARIDLDTFRVLPSEPHTAHFLVDFWQSPDVPHPACPRNLLKTVIDNAREAGFTAKCGVELEYWLFAETTDSLQEKGFRDLKTLSPGMYGYSWVRQGQHAALIEDVLDQLAAYDIDVESLHTETGPGVYETALRYSDPLKAADMAALFKSTMKILCARHGCSVTFMAKWNPSLPGSSGHIHQSLWNEDGSENMFSDPKDPDGLSEVARQYIAGLVECSPDLTALFSPTVNSYKRYVPGMWAPLTASWGIENRTCSIRVINGPKPSSTRVEFRQPAADINPHTAIATSMAAGLHGIAKKLTPPAQSSGDATDAGDAGKLPLSLEAATAQLRDSKVARDVLPAPFIDHYVRTRDWEVRQHRISVSDWELQRYFEVI